MFGCQAEYGRSDRQSQNFVQFFYYTLTTSIAGQGFIPCSQLEAPFTLDYGVIRNKKHNRGDA